MTFTEPFFDTRHIVSLEHDGVCLYLPGDALDAIADRSIDGEAWPTEGILCRFDMQALVADLINAHRPGGTEPLERGDTDAIKDIEATIATLQSACSQLRAALDELRTE